MNKFAAQEFLFAASSGEYMSVLRCAYDLTGLPVEVVDNAFCPIASYRIEEIMDTGANSRPSDLDRQERQRWEKIMSETDEPVIDNHSGNPFRALCYDVVYKGKHIAKASFFELRPFVESDKHIMKLMCAALGGMMYSHFGELERLQDTKKFFLVDLLTRNLPKKAIKDSWSRIGGKDESDWIVLAIQDENQRAIRLDGRILRSIEEKQIYNAKIDNILAVLCSEREFNEWLEQERPLCEEYFRMGISCHFEDLTKAEVYRKQAKFALSCAHKQRESCLFYNDVRLNDIALQLTKSKSPTAYCRSELWALISYDQTHRTELYRTFCAYLRKNMNLAKAAEELFIHYNTMKYRMKTIREITELESIGTKLAAELLIGIEILEIIGTNDAE